MARGGSGRQRLAALLVALAAVLVPAAAAGATDPAGGDRSGSIDHVQPDKGGIEILYSVPGLPEGVDPDLGTVAVTVEGEPVEASAEVAGEAEEQAVRRTAILAIDVSNSMAGERFEEAKRAALTFLDVVSPDVYVGIVSFASEVKTVQEPSLDRTASIERVNQLTLSQWTNLNAGVLQAVDVAGGEGQRNILVLSDGRDTSHLRGPRTKLSTVTAAIAEAGVNVDVVALAQGPAAEARLRQMAEAGHGRVLPVADPTTLSQYFSDEAMALASQLQIGARLPADLPASEGTLTVSVDAGGETYTDTAFVTFVDESAQPIGPAGPREVAAPPLTASPYVLAAGLLLAGLALLVLVASAIGAMVPRAETLEERIAAYTRTGESRSAAGTQGARQDAAGGGGFADSAVDLAQRALAGNQRLETSLASQLERAGLRIKPAEWLLIHAGIALTAGLLGFLLGSGGILATLLFLLIGGLAPWAFLVFRRNRRVRAFDGQLAETLQLMSGSITAGLSLAQSVDTVVREGADPIAAEFRRALAEARLGVAVEDALEGVAARMGSADFGWVVMAVRIQRDVGGNLAELLLKVSETLRERESLRRHVKALSAEGVLSAWILVGLPIVFVAYLALVRPEYLSPLLTTPLGWMMLATGAVLMLVGTFWMTRVVKVDL